MCSVWPRRQGSLMLKGQIIWVDATPMTVEVCRNRECQQYAACRRFKGLWFCIKRCWRYRRSLSRVRRRWEMQYA